MEGMKTLLALTIVGVTSGCNASPGTSMRLSLTSPIVVDVTRSDRNAFVDYSARQAWYYFASEGLGDNPSRLSDLRITFTMLEDHVAIDSYASGDLFFRSPGYGECDRFTGWLDRSDGRVDIIAKCSFDSQYDVIGSLFF